MKFANLVNNILKMQPDNRIVGLIKKSIIIFIYMNYYIYKYLNLGLEGKTYFQIEAIPQEPG